MRYNIIIIDIFHLKYNLYIFFLLKNYISAFLVYGVLLTPYVTPLVHTVAFFLLPTETFFDISLRPKGYTIRVPAILSNTYYLCMYSAYCIGNLTIKLIINVRTTHYVILQ